MEEKKEENEIRIYNSLPETKSMNFHFHLTYPNTTLYVVERLSTRQGLWLLVSFLHIHSIPDTRINGYDK